MIHRPLAASTGGHGSAREGSAYIVVLLVLAVLTVIGLALVTVAQTEMQIGSNERIAARTLYAADAGVGVAVARVLVNNDHTATTVVLREDADAGALSVGQRIELSPFHPILDAPCNLCSINQGQDFLQVNHAVAVTSSRVFWTGAEPGDNARRQASKTLGVMIEIQPWQMTSESVESLNLDADELKQIRF